MISAQLTRSVIDVSALVRQVESVSNGAAVLFLGTVRNTNAGRAVLGIDYSAYEPMAAAMLKAIAAEAGTKFSVADVAVAHRIGELALGDVSVAIATSHPHRAAAFEAARYIIEEIKKRVPIWKCEHYEDGTREWVDQSGRPRAQEMAE